MWVRSSLPLNSIVRTRVPAVLDHLTDLDATLGPGHLHLRARALVTGGRPVGRNGAFEVAKLLARDETNAFQRRELILSFAGIFEYQIEFAQMFVRAAMTAVECQRLLIVLHRGPKLPQPMVCISDVVVNFCIARVAQSRELERCDGSFPIAGRKCLLAGCKIGVEPLDCVERCHRGADRPVPDRRRRFAGAVHSAEPRRDGIAPSRPAECVSGTSRHRCAEYEGPRHGASKLRLPPLRAAAHAAPLTCSRETPWLPASPAVRRRHA